MLGKSPSIVLDNKKSVHWFCIKKSLLKSTCKIHIHHNLIPLTAGFFWYFASNFEWSCLRILSKSNLFGISTIVLQYKTEKKCHYNRSGTYLDSTDFFLGIAKRERPRRKQKVVNRVWKLCTLHVFKNHGFVLKKIWKLCANQTLNNITEFLGLFEKQ